MKDADEATNPLADISVVPEPSVEALNERQQIDYRSQREQCLDWLLVFGKDPKQADGYAHTPVKYRSHRRDQFYRWSGARTPATRLTREEDLAAAQTQLWHKSLEITMKYDQAPVEDRQDPLDRRG